MAADVVWSNIKVRAPGGDRSWGNPANWLGGSPVDPASDNALVKAWPDVSQAPVVDAEGKKAKGIYFDEGASLALVESGRLEIETVVLGAGRRDAPFGCPVKIAIFRPASFEALSPPDGVAQ